MKISFLCCAISSAALLPVHRSRIIASSVSSPQQQPYRTVHRSSIPQAHHDTGGGISDSSRLWDKKNNQDMQSPGPTVDGRGDIVPSYMTTTVSTLLVSSTGAFGLYILLTAASKVRNH
jgi:hypothetical protein